MTCLVQGAKEQPIALESGICCSCSTRGWRTCLLKGAHAMHRYADKANMEVGLLFTCRLGNVDLDRPVGELADLMVHCCQTADGADTR